MRVEDIPIYASLPKRDLEYLSWCEAARLPEYSASLPTGVTPGKRWRRHDGSHDYRFIQAGGKAVWLLCEYGPEKDGKCAILRWRPRVRVRARTTRMVPFRLGALPDDKRREIDDWMIDNLGYEPPLQDVGMTGKYDPHFLFKTDSDAIAFVLRWSDYWSKSSLAV